MPRRKVEDKILAFRQHGFRERSRSGNQVIGDCPLCGKHGHFYINEETKQWDCKRCGQSGGFQTFLQQVVEVSHQFPGLERKLELLAENRGLSVDTLQFYNIGFNLYTGEYLLPIYYQDAGETHVWDIRRYEIGGALRSTSDCSLGILGWEAAPAFGQLWICEGEWDAMACFELLQKLGIQEAMPLGVPGAGTFKTQWIGLFQNHEVVVAYDADEPGRKGAVRVYNMLHSRANSLKFVHWGPDVKDGYDLRDCYVDMGTAAFDHIMARLHSLPEGAEDSLGVHVPVQYNGEGLSAEDVYTRYTKWLFMPNTVLLDVVFGAVIANRTEGDPLWMHIVAPPGGTKTEVLRSLTEAADIVFRNTLSSKSLVSGQVLAGGADPSLLPRLHNKVLVVEDWTTVMSLPAVFREELFGILRSAYNGKYEREYGNGRYVKIDCHFGMLTGVTPAIEHNAEMMSALGERFLNYVPPIPTDIAGRRPYLLKSQENSGHEVEMRQELLTTAREALAQPFDIVPTIPAALGTQVLDAAQWTALMRGVVRREKYGAMKEITHEPYSELGTRLVKQFTKLIGGVARFRQVSVAGAREYDAIRWIAYGSAPTDRRKVVEAMWVDPERGWTMEEIAELTGLPKYPMCERVAETLGMLKMVRKVRGLKGVRSTYLFHLEEDFRQLTANAGVFNNHQ